MSDKNVTEVALPDAAGIARTARLLESGELVAVPTETVYGLAARADSAAAVARIYAAKGRPDFNPLIVHVRDLEQACAIAEFDPRALVLAERFWPGPLTLVLPLRPGANIAKAVTAGLDTIALRMPAHPVMAAVLAETGLPLAAPSANASEQISPTRPDHVRASLEGRLPLILDGGASEAGIESTIAALRSGGEWSLLRPGPVTRAELEAVLGEPAQKTSKTVEAPGQLARHYSPGKPVRLNAAEAAGDEFFIGLDDARADAVLSASGDLSEAAAKLYDALHQGAASAKPRIAVAPIPNEGIGAAINDRLKRAAAPND